MKKIFTLAACAALCTSTLLADIKIGDTTYPTLAEAVTAAQENDVITLSGNVPTSDVITINKTITLNGENNAIINPTKTDALVFAINAASKPTISNITIDGNNSSWSKFIIEINNENTNATLSNVTVQNVKTSAKGVIQVKGKAKSTVENITITNCTVAENACYGFCGSSDGFTLKGDNSTLSIFIEARNRISANNNALTNQNPINVLIEGSKRNENDVIVAKCKDASKFEFLGCADGYGVRPSGSDLKYVKLTYVAEHNGVQKETLEDAYEAAQNSEDKNIYITKDIELGQRHAFTVGNLIINGKTGNEKLIRNHTTDQMLLTNGATTLKNLTIDFNNNSDNSKEGQIEVGNANLTLDNVTFVNEPEGKSTIYAKGKRKVNLKDVKGTPTVLLKYYNQANNDFSTAEISGDNEVKFKLENLNNYITVPEGSSLTNDDNKPIEIEYTQNPSDASAGTVVVKGYADPKKFHITHTGWTLAAKDGNLVLSKAGQTGVEDVMAEDADAPVEWFNLQGIRVANPENGIYIRRQCSKIEKVVL